MSEFFTHRDIKATRKAHTCMGCSTSIPQGASAFYFSTKQEGFFWSGHYHSECRLAEVALNDLHGNYGDDFIGLQYIGDEPEDVAWLKEEFPAVAVAMGFIIAEAQ